MNGLALASPVPLRAAQRRASAPSAARRIRLGMPHLDAGGLAESWLFRHVGDLHWEAICTQLAVETTDIRDDDFQRLYPTVVALRARYQAPLAAVRENDVFDAAIEVAPCGRACAEGHVRATAGPVRLAVALLTTFAARQPDGTMRTARPAAALAERWRPIQPLSRLALVARAARRCEPLDDPFVGPRLDRDGPVLGAVRYTPSPYADYNGARLLYFAAYPTIADTVERQLVTELAVAPPATADWALTASPIARDVFYYGNLPLGEALAVELVSLEHSPAARRVKTRVRLRRARDQSVIADVITERALVEAREPA